MNKNIISFILLILFIVALYVFQNTVVGPGVEKIAASDLFLDTTFPDEPQLRGVINERTNFALLHCHRYLRENYELNDTDVISEKDYKAWGLGGADYVIRSHVDVPVSEEGPTRKTITCKITFRGGDEFESANWEISGFNYN